MKNLMYNLLLLNFINIMILIILVLVGVAFLTLLERKILGYVQDRKGPNKMGFLGLFQPFNDAIKLFKKEIFKVYKSNYVLYYICPVLNIFLMLMIWMVYPYFTNIYFMNYSILLMIIILSLSSFMLLFMGWSSNSLYSMLGAMRSVAQTLSYEVSFIMIILVLMILSESYSVKDFMIWQIYIWYLVLLMPLFIMFFLSILAELNRTPMDFIEGESELVSGFNVEYFSGGFAMIFMAEYGYIIFLSWVLMLMFTNLLWNYLLMIMFLNIFSSMVIFMRGMLPRMRYDELMNLCWKIILPLILNYILYILGIKLWYTFYL